MKLIYHLQCQFYKSIAVLSMHSHVDRQPQWFAAPGGSYLQCQNDQIQSPRIDNALLCRADGISPITGTIDFSSTVVEQRIVQSEGNSSCAIKDFDKHQSQDLPEFVDVPARIWKETVIGVVSTPKAWIGKWKDAGNGSSSRTQNPAGHQTRENLCTRSSKNWKKLLNYIRPCRSNCMHIGLPVLIFYPIKTSAGRYVFVDKPLKLAA
jgi:hypothetical protein